MTVTYRHAADETGSVKGSGGPFTRDWRPGRADRNGFRTTPQPGPCPSCDTRFDVLIDTREAVIIRVRGRTCQVCNPHRREPPGAAGGRLRIGIMPTRPSDGPLRIETISENVEDKSASYLPEHVASTPHWEQPTEVNERTNVAWRNAVVPIVSTIFDMADLRTLEHAWQPDHCEALEAVAAALDNVWTIAVPTADETVIALRVVGLPDLVAALVVNVADRSAATAREPIALTGELLRFTGISFCAATQHAVTCGQLRHEFDTVPEVADEGLVQLLDTGFTRALTASTSAITISDLLGVLHPEPDRIRVEFEIEEPGKAPIGPIEQSRVVTAGSLDGPSTAAIFGS